MGRLVFPKISSMASAKSRLRRAFSVSSFLRRLAPDTYISPKLLPQRCSLASEKPCLRHSSATARPASASRRKPIICSSVNVFFTSNLLSVGLDSKLRRYSNQGVRRINACLTRNVWQSTRGHFKDVPLLYAAPEFSPQSAKFILLGILRCAYFGTQAVTLGPGMQPAVTDIKPGSNLFDAVAAFI